jgi:O-acetylhomoserine (thiol)-lyase
LKSLWTAAFFTREIGLMSSSSKHPETISLHAGWRADPATGAVAVPIYQTTSYQFHNTEHAANLFALKELGNIYTRIMNPTNDVLEKRIAALEGGVGALALASGQAASAFAIQNVARAGDNVVSSTDLYGGTWNLFANTLKDQGIEVRFVDPIDPNNFRRATDDRTRAYYAETLPNPKLTVFPIAEVADIGRNFGIPLIAAVRSWRGDRGLFLDQISRRPRQLDRRSHRRQRHVRLGRASGAPASAQYA